MLRPGREPVGLTLILNIGCLVKLKGIPHRVQQGICEPSLLRFEMNLKLREYEKAALSSKYSEREMYVRFQLHLNKILK